MTDSPAVSEIEIRHCTTLDEYEECVRIEHVTWGPELAEPSGMFVVAQVSQGIEPEGLLAPEQGVSRDEKGLPTALVVGRAGRVEFRSLETGAEIGNQWLVRRGLAPGDHLIVEGQQKVKPGDVVIERPVTLNLAG